MTAMTTAQVENLFQISMVISIPRELDKNAIRGHPRISAAHLDQVNIN